MIGIHCVDCGKFSHLFCHDCSKCNICCRCSSGESRDKLKAEISRIIKATDYGLVAFPHPRPKSS